MSRGEVVFTTAAAAGLVCVVAAAVCVWAVVADPAALAGLASEGHAGSASIVVRLVVRAASAVLALLGW